MSDPIDFEDLLRRYMKHVDEVEGTDFIHRLNDADTARFSDAEVALLQRLSQENRPA